MSGVARRCSWINGPHGTPQVECSWALISTPRPPMRALFIFLRLSAGVATACSCNKGPQGTPQVECLLMDTRPPRHSTCGCSQVECSWALMSTPRLRLQVLFYPILCVNRSATNKQICQELLVGAHGTTAHTEHHKQSAHGRSGLHHGYHCKFYFIPSSVLEQCHKQTYLSELASGCSWIHGPQRHSTSRAFTWALVSTPRLPLQVLFYSSSV